MFFFLKFISCFEGEYGISDESTSWVDALNQCRIATLPEIVPSSCYRYIRKNKCSFEMNITDTSLLTELKDGLWVGYYSITKSIVHVGKLFSAFLVCKVFCLNHRFFASLTSYKTKTIRHAGATRRYAGMTKLYDAAKERRDDVKAGYLYDDHSIYRYSETYLKNLKI